MSITPVTHSLDTTHSKAPTSEDLRNTTHKIVLIVLGLLVIREAYKAIKKHRVKEHCYDKMNPEKCAAAIAQSSLDTAKVAGPLIKNCAANSLSPGCALTVATVFKQ